MQAYKIDLSGFTGKVRKVVSEAVQRKAFELGYEWNSRKPMLFDKSWLYFGEDGDITWDDHDIAQYELISAADFLALTTAKDEPVFKPFDKVLVRYDEREKWFIDIFSFRENLAYACTGGCLYPFCIPYEGNEALLGTTDSPK